MPNIDAKVVESKQDPESDIFDFPITLISSVSTGVAREVISLDSSGAKPVLHLIRDLFSWVNPTAMPDSPEAKESALLNSRNIIMDFLPDTLETDPLKYLLSKCKPARPATSFEKAFPNLSKLDEYYWSKNLSELAATLNEESKRYPSDLEVFGVKIPNEAIAFFDLGALLVLLVYFLLVCRYIGRHVIRIDLDQASQWTFLLNEWPFFVVAVATICILPALSSWLSVLLATSPSWYRWPLLGLALIITVLSIFSALGLYDLRRRVRTEKQSAGPSIGGNASDVEA